MTIDDVITILNSKDCMLATAGMCLMRYKERDCWKCILKEYSKTVYNKAIDDFADKAQKECDIQNWSKNYGISFENLEKISEQLKAGENRE